MPTVAVEPTLEATQAVGALLLHQFARERFLEAGLDENLIHEAEEREHLDALASILLEEEDQPNNSQHDTESVSHNATNNSTIQTDFSSRYKGDESEQRSYYSNESSTAYASFQTNSNDTTLRASQIENSRQEGQSELFHSVAESTNGSIRRADRPPNRGSSDKSASQRLTSPFEKLKTSPGLAAYGKELRRIAEEFEKSRLRDNVKDRASQVNLQDITREAFVKLLEELFQEKITREKIVILFFFCTDVALRAALSAQDLVVKLLGWSFSYIVNTVCSFVYKLGGWDKLLTYNFILNELPKLMVSGCALMAMVWLGISIRKSLKD